MRLNHVLILLMMVLLPVSAKSQNREVIEVNMTLEEVIEMAQRQSLSYFRAKNMYLAEYWSFRSFKASRLPSLNLTATPVAYTNSIIPLQDGVGYRNNYSFVSNGALFIRQNVPLTGGTFDITSTLSRTYDYETGNTIFSSAPVSIGFKQSLNGYNRFRWESRMSPVQFERAKLAFIQDLEDIAYNATNYFFNVATAEINVRIAEINYANADTLYRIGKGRFEIGTITQDELLDLELSLLNARLEVSKSDINLKQAKATLNSFLGIADDIHVNCVLPDKLPPLRINVDEALNLALENNPDILGYKLQLLRAERNVAETTANTGLNANIEASLGINRNALELSEVYESPFMQQQRANISLSIPIIDWGNRKGQIQMAKAQKDEVDASVKQSLVDFEQNALITFLNFNLQEDQVAIAAKADTVAQLGFDVTMQRFMIGKVDVIRLNSARNSLDAAKRNYISALRNYWTSYYDIRRIAMYDFINRQSLIRELDEFLQR
jgi:outer membrane protein TolC